ncbi:MAG TPA: 6-bladed beta-propeller [Longimicrobiaceae bacterium]|nr:6-bladed beta-propeller [Longimicrobiaceae bacterium]
MDTAFPRCAWWFGLLAALAACRDAGSYPVDRLAVDTLANGTVVVSNPEHGVWDGASAWKVTEDLRIGSADGEGADVFAAPSSLEVDAWGRIFVLDQQAREVRIFDARGRHVRSFGRRGAGPGELERPVALSWGADGELWVVDPGNARFSVFDTTGAFRRMHIRFNGFMMEPWPGIVDGFGRVYDVGMVEERRERTPVLVRFARSFERADTFRLPSHRAVTFELQKGSRIHYSAPVPFTPAMVWALTPGGLVWSGSTDRYRLRLHRPEGDTLRVVERVYRPVEVESVEMDSIPRQMEWFTRQGGKIDLSRVPRTKPAFVSVRVDDRGYLWVRPSAPAADQKAAFDVFDPQGLYLGRVRLPAEIPDGLTLVIRGDLIYSVQLSDLGVPQVVRYRIHGRAGRGELIPHL